MSRKNIVCLFFLQLTFSLLVPPVWSGTTGKISGIVTDLNDEDPLYGAKVQIEELDLMAEADEKGRYIILNVPPGLYTVKVKFVGYHILKIHEVRVNIDQTICLNAQLNMEFLCDDIPPPVVDGNAIQRNVTGSVDDVSSEEIENLPLADISDIVNLRAGIHVNLEHGIQIRGSVEEEALYLVDGIAYRDPGNNTFITGLPLSSIKALALERSGFEAEYGQVQAGIIHVVTKEGNRKSYFGTLTAKTALPHAKHFGLSPFDANSVWLRPYLDDAVCWTGTGNGSWDTYTQNQYPSFEGWYKYSQRLLEDEDPSNDLTPIGAQREFAWQHRKTQNRAAFDYNMDAGFGGPVPLIGQYLGHLRFFTAFQRKREMFIVPLSRDDYQDWDWTVKLTSDLSDAMRLTVRFDTGKQLTVADNRSVSDFTGLNYLRDSESIVNTFGDKDYRLFSTGYFSLADLSHNLLSVKLRHILNQKTFYETAIHHIIREKWARPPAARDTARIYQIEPAYYTDESLYGYSAYTPYARARNDSRMTSTVLKFDLTSQLTFNHLLKTGFELTYSDLDMHFGYVSSLSGADEAQNVMRVHSFPVRGALYVQDKMEFDLLTVKLGLRLDYSNPNTGWFDLKNLYDSDFFSADYNPNADYPEKRLKTQWSLSPRIGVSHLLTERSKLFFNYGHFSQLPMYQEIFRMGRDESGAMQYFSDPDLNQSKTIAYELGYEHALFGQFMVQAAGFYRDIRHQRSTVMVDGPDDVHYTLITDNRYGDYRGVELILQRRTGKWLSGFVNYTYQVFETGLLDNQPYQEIVPESSRLRPVPQPFVRTNIHFRIPGDFEKLNLFGVNAFGNIDMSLTGQWRAGAWFTYNPNNVPGVSNNIQKKPFYDMILRFSKAFIFDKMKIDLFVEINNLLNSKFLNVGRFDGISGNPSFGCFWDDQDYQAYMNSLHLPESEAYDNIPGDDRIGDYRDENAAYQPIALYNVQMNEGVDGVIYYDNDAGRYLTYTDGSWIAVEEGRMNRILEDRAYIDMPNMTSFHFLNPRSVFFGLRLSFDLN